MAIIRSAKLAILIYLGTYMHVIKTNKNNKIIDIILFSVVIFAAINPSS